MIDHKSDQNKGDLFLAIIKKTSKKLVENTVNKQDEPTESNIKVFPIGHGKKRFYVDPTTLNNIDY